MEGRLHRFIFLSIPPTPRSTLFPYTTLFRSGGRHLCSAHSSNLPLRADSSSLRLPDGATHLGFIAAQSVDRKSTRLNSSHVEISYAVFCAKIENNGSQSKRRRPAPNGYIGEC